MASGFPDGSTVRRPTPQKTRPRPSTVVPVLRARLFVLHALGAEVTCHTSHD